MALCFFNTYGVIAKDAKMYYIKNNVIHDGKIPCVLVNIGDGPNCVFMELTLEEFIFFTKVINKFDNNEKFTEYNGAALSIELFDPYHLDEFTLDWDGYKNSRDRFDIISNYLTYSCKYGHTDDLYQIIDDVNEYLKKYNITPKIYTSDEEIKKDQVQ